MERIEVLGRDLATVLAAGICCDLCGRLAPEDERGVLGCRACMGDWNAWLDEQERCFPEPEDFGFANVALDDLREVG